MTHNDKEITGWLAKTLPAIPTQPTANQSELIEPVRSRGEA